MKKKSFIVVVFLFTILSCRESAYKAVQGENIQYGIDSVVREDTGLNQWLTSYRDSLNGIVSTVLIKSSKVHAKGLPESPLGNLLADVLLEKTSKRVQKVDFALLNNGGIRAPLPQGEVTVGHVMEVLPFMNYVVVLELPGETVKKLLDHWAAKGGAAVSGVRFKIVNEMAVNIEVGGKPLDRGQKYKVATIDYLADGGDGCDFLKGTLVLQRTQWLLMDLYIEAFKEMNQKGMVINTSNDGRVTREP